MKKHFARGAWALAALAGVTLFSTGCDPGLKATVENGIITSSTSLFGAIVQAGLQLAVANANQQNSNSTTGT